jgi:amidohydrolase
MNRIKKIKALSKEHFNEIVAIRRHLHANPELSFEEYQTSAFIEEKLKQFQIPFKSGFVKTGIVAHIEGKNPSKKVVALRADMDALPIQEENKVEYCSKNAGVMHACGHDVHTACLLGAAKILNELKNEFEGTVKLIFQPAEEKLPGGASLMIKEGALENPKTSAIIGLHVFPSMESGKVGFRSGMYMASTDELYVTIQGKGGHGALPHLTIDPVLISAHLIVGLQQIVSRNAQPIIPSVLSFGKVIANGATNVIPAEVKLEGTFRTLDESWRTEAHKRMRELACGMVESMGGKCEFEIKRGYPVLYNNEELTQRSEKTAIEYLGNKNVEKLDLRMTAEDFAYYTQEIPGCFYRLGTGNISKGITSNVHTSTFDIDENALEIGMGLMSCLALRELNKS